MIGVYDSGVGGLSVWKELRAVMPAEYFCYVSDGAYCPYGPKDPSFVIERAQAVARFLIAQGAELIVVACNTATAAFAKRRRGRSRHGRYVQGAPLSQYPGPLLRSRQSD